MALLIGWLIGLVLGLTGAGGSIFAVPLLILLLDLPVNEAMGLALGAVAVSAIYGTFISRKQVLWLPGLVIAVGGVLSAPFGKFVALQLDEVFLLLGFSTLAFFIGIRTWVQATKSPEFSEMVRANIGHLDTSDKTFACRFNSQGQFQLKPRCLSGLIFFGLLIGFTSGLFGVGGGFLIVPTLIYLSQITMLKAIGTSLFIISLISTSGFVAHLNFSGVANISILLKIIAMSFLGMLASHFLAKKVTGVHLQKLFSFLLIMLSLFTVTIKLLDNSL